MNLLIDMSVVESDATQLVGSGDTVHQTIQERMAAIKQRIALQETALESGETGEAGEEETQVIKPLSLPQLEVDIDPQELAEKVDSIDDRVKALAEQKRQERMTSRQQLEQDISTVTLTDEENDEQDSVFDKQTMAQIKGAQQILDNATKENFFETIQQQRVTNKKKFSMASFVDDFAKDFDQTSPKLPVQEVDEDEEEVNVSSPVTSPVKSPIKHQTPIEIYKQNLKGQLIDLDEDIEVPELPKDKQLSIKRNFSKPAVKADLGRENKKLLNNLFHMNIHQMNAHPQKQVQIEEDQEEEIMENLLEQEIERSRNVRRKEKLREKAAKQLLGKSDIKDIDEEDDGDWERSDWEESEGEGGKSGSDEDEENGEKSGSDHDDAEGNDESDEEISGITHKKGRRVDSDEEEDNEEVQEKEVLYQDSDLSFQNSQLFQNLEPMTLPVIDDVPSSQIQVQSDNETQNAPSVLTQPGAISTQRIETQEDIETQADSISTQADETQRDTTKIIQTTQVDGGDLDDITPETVNSGREAIKLNRIEERNEDEEDEVDDEGVNEEDMQAQIKAYEAKIRRKELKLLQKRKEMERKGFKNIIEGEAEESDDEWAGVGGIDGEADDDKANSEDEKMIDNNFNIILNDEEVRKKFMEQYQIKDKKELEKLLDDIKNHRLTKKAGAYNIDLSDEEDELLLNYRRQKLMEQRLKLQDLSKSMGKLKSDKSKAFFESIKEDLAVTQVKIDEDDDDPEMYTNKIEAKFVQSKLSFLTNSVNDYDNEQKRSNYQYGISDSEEEDLSSLKMKSFNNLKRSIREVEVDTDHDDDVNEEKENLDDFEDEDDLIPLRKPSMVKSFRSASSLSTVSSFSGVTVSKQYKTASGSKAAITFMSKLKKTKLSKLKSRILTPKE